MLLKLLHMLICKNKLVKPYKGNQLVTLLRSVAASVQQLYEKNKDKAALEVSRVAYCCCQALIGSAHTIHF